ncbi:MAG: NAD(P)H-binding protein [Chitinophagales bacterium]|nr:NAD(P)H-binding protein [Chitinophagales bacterium]
MKNVIITGASGMIGGIILQNCLQNKDIKQVTSIVRKKSGIENPKLNEVIHTDFSDFSPISRQLKGYDICFYCIGVYTGEVNRDTFREITVDYTKAFAEVLRKENAKTTFCFLSGQGADRKEKSRLMFAKDKGIAENILLGLSFDQLYIFRPGYIYPVTPRKEPNLTYRMMRVLYKYILSKVYPQVAVTSEGLAKVMTHAGLYRGNKTTYENKDILYHLAEMNKTPPVSSF